VIKCNVCGSENEAAALFCGTCGSPLSPADAKAIVDEATKPEVVTPAGPDDTVVPGQGAGARRDLGTGAAQDATVVQPPAGAQGQTDVEDDVASGKPTIVCSVCATVNDATRTYCRKCANELKPAPPPPPPPPPAPTPRKISPVAIGLGAAAVVVAIALIGVLALGGSPAATLAPTARASQPAATVLASAAPTVLPTAATRTFTEGARSGLVAFARCDSGGNNCAIYTIPADGKSRSTRITSTSPSAFDPSLSFDRKQVVYSVAKGLRVVTVKTKAYVEHSTGTGDSGASWSPDGKKLTFAGFRTRDNSGTDLEIRIDGATSGNSSPLTSNDVPDTQPVFTPDGKSIVYVEGDGNSAELKMIDIASKTITPLTTDQFEDRDPAVSPDGTEVVFASNRSGSGFDLFVLNIATLEITALPSIQGDERHPAFSPGGRYIVFSGGTAGAEDLFIFDRSNNKVVTLTTGPSSDIWPTWH
jgi:hypothetical protein